MIVSYVMYSDNPNSEDTVAALIKSCSVYREIQRDHRMLQRFLDSLTKDRDKGCALGKSIIQENVVRPAAWSPQGDDQ